MEKTLSFLFGKEVAYKMKLLEEGLQAIETKHRLYFTTTKTKLAQVVGEGRHASLAEFVQAHWLGTLPSLTIDPALPADIAAECLTCLQLIRTARLPVRRRRTLISLLLAFQNSYLKKAV